MTSLHAKLITTAARGALWKKRHALMAQTKRPKKEQQGVLSQVISALSETEYGRLLGVKSNDNYQTYRKRVPIVSYDHIRHLIERQRETERPVLVKDKVLYYARNFPHTEALDRSFNKAFSLELLDLLSLKLKLQSAQVFAAAMPQLVDDAYTGEVQLMHGQEVWGNLDKVAMGLFKSRAITRDLSQLNTPNDYLDILSATLMAQEHLEIISVLHPKFILDLIHHIKTNADTLIQGLSKGQMVRHGVTYEFKHVDKTRLKALLDYADQPHKLWPCLQVISCWTKAGAAPFIRSLSTLFPDVQFHAKGLLSKQTPITVPLAKSNGFVPLLGDVFFELEDEQGEIFALDQLNLGQEYKLIVSNTSGLYRYRLGESVRATHLFHNTPCLEYIGPSDIICDLSGEKLPQAFAAKSLTQLFENAETFSVLLPSHKSRKKPYYVLLTNCVGTDHARLSLELDKALCSAFHYRTARESGVLDPPKTLAFSNAHELYLEFHAKHGVKLDELPNVGLIPDLRLSHSLLSFIGSQEPSAADA